MYLKQGLIIFRLWYQERYHQLGTGNYDFHIEFLNLYPLDIKCIAKLEGANGKVYQQQLVEK